MIHGLDQEQFPSLSKEKYQVPDFLVLAETSALTHQPLLVEVKRVPRQKLTLRLRAAQVSLCESYASALNIPLVFATYWGKLNAWTLNTPDAFRRTASTHKISMATAFELDCGLILGDVSFFVSQSLTRTTCFDKDDTSGYLARHKQYGSLVSDVVALDEKRVELTVLESAAINSVLGMRTKGVKPLDDGKCEFTEVMEANFMPKLSSWITRHLRTFPDAPSERYANISAHVISDLMAKLDCPALNMFPSGRSDDLKQLEQLFLSRQGGKSKPPLPSVRETP